MTFIPNTLVHHASTLKPVSFALEYVQSTEYLPGSCHPHYPEDLIFRIAITKDLALPFMILYYFYENHGVA
jgi:hypothetical protein